MPESPLIEKVFSEIQEKISLLREKSPKLGNGMGEIRHYHSCQFTNIIPSQSILSLILQGEKLLQQKDTKIHKVYPKGSILLFPAGEPVSCINSLASDTCYLAITISFSEEILVQTKKHVSEIPSKNSQNYTRLLKSISTFLDFTMQTPDTTLARMQQEQILYLLYACGIQPFSLQNTLIAKIRTMVENAPAESWSTASFAQHFSMSERSLRRHLQKSGYGCTELIRLSRLHVGLSLLQKGNMRVGEIANYCGYESSSRFSERFREQFHISPTEILHGTQNSTNEVL